MITLELVIFGLAALFVLVGGLITVAARNPIRSAMGLLATIVGVAGMYLLLSAEFLAAVQVMVYAGAVVVLFLFVIMLLGPSSLSSRDTHTWSARYLGAVVFLAASIGVAVLLARVAGPATLPPHAPAALGTIEGIGHELFTAGLVPFELSSGLLLVAVVGAVAVARGRQPDPTMLRAGAVTMGGPRAPQAPRGEPPRGADEGAPSAHEKENAS
jgi:NADH-quinone oxidoreductase subunit J